MRFATRLVGVCLFAVAVMGAAGGVALGAARTGRVVVMISVDGLAGHYLDDPKAEMPNIRALAREGARAESMRASNPTVTWPNHATLMTGVNPARHGVVGNNYYDRETGKRVQLIADPIFDKDELVRVPTVYDVAHEAGLRTAAIRWPASRNARALDWTTPDVATIDLVRKYTTPALMAECEAAGIHIDGVGVEGQRPGHMDVLLSQDEEFVRAMKLILREHRPNLALLHLANVDHQEHLNGPRSPEAYAAIKEADRQVGEVWDELKRDFPGKATLIVVSDHGFSKIEHAVLPNVILREAGLVDVKGTRIVGGAVALVPQGGSAMLYIKKDAKDRAAVVGRVKEALAGAKGIRKVVGPEELGAYGMADPKDDPHAPDMLLLAKDGWIFGDTAAGALSFIEKPERKGSHGHDASIPGLHATFVAWGAGIEPGARVGEIANVDVAPTIAKLLGVEMKDVDGKVLEGVLAR